MNDIQKGSYVISNNPLGYENVHVMTVNEFITAATQGMEIDGDLYFYIPDFSEDQYNMIAAAIQDVAWFAFGKEEIPYWVNANIIKIFDNPKGQQTQVSQNAFFGDGSDPAPAAEPSFNPNFTPAPEEPQVQENTSVQEEPQNSPFMSEDVDDYFDENDEEIKNNILDLLESDQVQTDNEEKDAVVNLFGSSKGGTGKTFTCIISAYHYAKKHPGKKVCLLDADITDPQVAIAIHKVNPTLFNYWRSWSNGSTDFRFMETCKTQNSKFPSNLDFYLAPKDYVINNDKFWLNVLTNLIENYDVVFIDSGIDYVNINLLSYAYKIADRIVLVSTTSIKSTSSVLKQINRLKGNIPSVNAEGKSVYSPEDNIGSKLRLAITGYDASDKQNEIIIKSFQKQIKINAIFGQLSSKISKAEFYGEWNIFDKNAKFNENLDRLIDPEK